MFQEIDLAAVITALSLVITAVATLFVALKDRKYGGDSTEKAISVTKIKDTDKKVETLIQQVDFLFEEISRLRVEKDSLERRVARLTDELKREREDHQKTKQQIQDLLLQIAEKDRIIVRLEGEIVELKKGK